MEKAIKKSAQTARTWLQQNNFPYSDQITLAPSNKTFPEGGHYAIEIPVVNNLEILQHITRLLRSKGIKKAIFGETHGAFLLSDSEIKDMLSLCFEERWGMFFSIGPRPEYDRKAVFYRTEFGASQGRRLNNHDAMAYAVEEVFRLTTLGCRGIIVYDLGLLRILNSIREKGAIPKKVMFAASTHCMISNAITAQIYAENGADQLVILHDLDLPVIQEMRRILPNSVALSLPIDSYFAKGGFIRYYEIAEIIQIAAPIFIKLGGSAQTHPSELPDLSILKRRVDRVLIGLEHLNKVDVLLSELSDASPYWCVPEMKITTSVEV